MMSSQSVTINPWKPSSFLNTSMSRYLLACTGSPFISPELIMMVGDPAFTASRNEARSYSRSSISGMYDGVLSLPVRGPEYARYCFMQLATAVGFFNPSSSYAFTGAAAVVVVIDTSSPKISRKRDQNG